MYVRYDLWTIFEKNICLECWFEFHIPQPHFPCLKIIKLNNTCSTVSHFEICFVKNLNVLTLEAHQNLNIIVKWQNCNC